MTDAMSIPGRLGDKGETITIAGPSISLWDTDRLLLLLLVLLTVEWAFRKRVKML